MEKSDCKSDWIIKDGDLGSCPIHKQHFWVSKGHKCKFYTPTLISTAQKKDVCEKPIFEHTVEQGVSITNMDISVIPTKLQNEVLSASKVSHAFRFTVILKNPPNWVDRDKICRSKGLTVERRAGFGRVFMTSFKGHKIWLSDKSITIYFPEWRKYYVDEARFGLNFAIADLKIFLDELALFCDSNFLIDGSYRFRVGGQHHALIYNSLARMYNRNKEKLNVFDKNGELWLVIDNSRRESIRMDDIETVHPKTAVPDMDEVVSKFFNELKDTGLTPTMILEMEKNNQGMFERVAGLMKNQVEESRNVRADVDKRLEWMDKNFTSHQRILEKIETRLDALNQNKESSKESKSDRAKRLLRKYGW